tara:strand:- start:1411 stop:1617 length:207 start_codon:yes stop_codon:yes gene_type:complete
MGCLCCEVPLSCPDRSERVFAAYTRAILISRKLRQKRVKMLNKAAKVRNLTPNQLEIVDGYLLSSATK